MPEDTIPSPAAPAEKHKPTIQNVSLKHRQIMDFMLINPSMPLGQVAKHFNVTPGWLSIIVHSDAFIAVMKEKEELLFTSTVVPLRQKVQAAAHIGVEKVAEALHHASAISDKAFVVETTEKLLRTLDYGSPKAPTAPVGVQQNNFYVAEKEAVEQARDVMRQLQLKRKQDYIEGEVQEVRVIDKEKLLNSTA